jgi:transcriptional regulator with XRE-family HTH domain
MTSKLPKKLENIEYRQAFVASQINVGIPFQIRALLKARPGWTQTTLAEKAQMRQPSISALLTPGKTRPNIETLRRIANVFDCGLIVRFAPFSELARWSEDFDPESFTVPSFTEELQDTSAPEQLEEIAVAETQPARVSLAGLGLSPEHLARWGDLYRESANQSLRVYLDHYWGKQGSRNTFGDFAGAVKRQIRPKGKLLEMPKRSEATHLKRRFYVRREQRTEQRPTRSIATG